MLTQLLMHDWFAIDWIALYCYLLPDSSTKDHLKQNRNQTCVYCRTGLKSKIFVARLYQLFHYKKKQEAVAHSRWIVARMAAVHQQLQRSPRESALFAGCDRQTLGWSRGMRCEALTALQPLPAVLTLPFFVYSTSFVSCALF